MATIYGYEDICKKPFRKISERTVVIGLYKNNGAVSCVGNYYHTGYTLVYRKALPLILYQIAWDHVMDRY